MDGEFSVYQWFPNDQYEKVCEFVDSETAVRMALNLCVSIGGRLGTTVKVMITDGGDCSTWEWTHEEGMIFPPEIAGLLKKGVKDEAWYAWLKSQGQSN